MIDLVKLKLLAGNGGDGRVAFRREKYVPKGGPNGGDGGRGGNIIVRVNPKLTTLQHLSHIKQIAAQMGKPGGKQLMTGESGEDVVLEVPVGTVIWLTAENQVSRRRRLKYGVKWRLPKSDARFEKFYLSKEGEAPPVREPDEPQLIDVDVETQRDEAVEVSNQFNPPAIKLIELMESGQEFVIVQGGFGGRGNDRFKGSTNTTPLEAEYGTFGEQKTVLLELKLLADVGLVGLPNAGKSTLISRLTKARPKIANYPFTTLEPHLGVLQLGREPEVQELVIADIPGLIEGAHQGKGLGFTFLRHVEHCRVLLYVLALPDEVTLDETLNAAQKADQLWGQFQTLQSELRSHSLAFLAKKQLLMLNKIDIYNSAEIDEIARVFVQRGEELLLASAVTGAGIETLKQKLQQVFAAA